MGMNGAVTRARSRCGFSRFTSGLLTACLPLAGGCSADPPYAASTNLSLTTEEERTVRVLGPAEQAEAKLALSELVEGQSPVDPPHAAPASFRWEDVELAAILACEEIEAAVMAVTVGHDRCQFKVRTVEDWPGELFVRRLDGDGYEVTASIGRFPHRPEQASRAEQLEAAFRRTLTALGRKRGFDED